MQEAEETREMLPVVTWFTVSECPVPRADRWLRTKKKPELSAACRVKTDQDKLAHSDATDRVCDVLLDYENKIFFLNRSY